MNYFVSTHGIVAVVSRQDCLLKESDLLPCQQRRVFGWSILPELIVRETPKGYVVLQYCLAFRINLGALSFSVVRAIGNIPSTLSSNLAYSITPNLSTSQLSLFRKFSLVFFVFFCSGGESKDEAAAGGSTAAAAGRFFFFAGKPIF